MSISRTNIIEQGRIAAELQEAGYVKPRKSLKKLLFGLAGIRELPPLSRNVQFVLNKTTGKVVGPGPHFSLWHYLPIPGAVQYAPVPDPELEFIIDVTPNPPGTKPENQVGFQTAPSYRVIPDQFDMIDLRRESHEFRMAKRALETEDPERKEGYLEALSERIPGLVRLEPVLNEKKDEITGIRAQVPATETFPPQLVQIDGMLTARYEDAYKVVTRAGQSPTALLTLRTFAAIETAVSEIPADQIRNPETVDMVEYKVTKDIGRYAERLGMAVRYKNQGGIRMSDIVVRAEQRRMAAENERQANRIEARAKAEVIQIFTAGIVKTANDLEQPISVSDALKFAVDAAGRDQWTDVARDTKAPLSLIMNTGGSAGSGEARRIGDSDTLGTAQAAYALAQQTDAKLNRVLSLLDTAPDSSE